jgi:hypothetical protein
MESKTVAVAGCTALLLLLPLLLVLRRRRGRRRHRYVILRASQCSAAERAEAAALVRGEFGAEHAELQAARGFLPLVLLALSLQPARRCVGSVTWDSSAKPNNESGVSFVARLRAQDGASDSTVRRRAQLFGLSDAEVHHILHPPPGVPAREDPAYAPLFTMMARGMPLFAARQKAQLRGLNPDALDAPDEPAPKPGPKRTPSSCLPRVAVGGGVTLPRDGCVTMSHLVVHADHRRQGLGEALARVGAAYLAARGADAAFGMARTTALIAYYERLGAAAAFGNAPGGATMQRYMTLPFSDREDASMAATRARLPAHIDVLLQ